MEIKKATPANLDELYELGLRIPELKVNKTEDFMEKSEFKTAIESKDSVFLFASYNKKPVGFIYARDRQIKKGNACLSYIAVLKEYRRLGIAESLWAECQKRLKERGVSYVYSWVHSGKKPIMRFMEKQKFKSGDKFIFADKRI